MTFEQPACRRVSRNSLLAGLGLLLEELQPSKHQSLPDLLRATEFFGRLPPIESDPTCGVLLRRFDKSPELVQRTLQRKRLLNQNRLAHGDPRQCLHRFIDLSVLRVEVDAQKVEIVHDLFRDEPGGQPWRRQSTASRRPVPKWADGPGRRIGKAAVAPLGSYQSLPIRQPSCDRRFVEGGPPFLHPNRRMTGVLRRPLGPASPSLLQHSAQELEQRFGRLVIGQPQFGIDRCVVLLFCGKRSCRNARRLQRRDESL